MNIIYNECYPITRIAITGNFAFPLMFIPSTMQGLIYSLLEIICQKYSINGRECPLPPPEQCTVEIQTAVHCRDDNKNATKIKRAGISFHDRVMAALWRDK